MLAYPDHLEPKLLRRVRRVGVDLQARERDGAERAPHSHTAVDLAFPRATALIQLAYPARSGVLAVQDQAERVAGCGEALAPDHSIQPDGQLLVPCEGDVAPRVRGLYGGADGP